MKKLLMITFFVTSISTVCFSQWPGSYYVAAKNGLSVREIQDINSNVLAKIPYGTKVAISYLDETVKYNAEGMEGHWANITYNGKKGYIVNIYLLPWPPPKITKSTVENSFEMKNYFAQVTIPFGQKLVLKSGTPGGVDDSGWELTKQMYKNGAEWHHLSTYESGSDEYFLPGFTLEQGFLLARLIPEFNEVFGENDAFPTESRTFKKGDIEYMIRVDKQTYGEGANTYSWIERIHVEFSPGASYTFELFRLGNQLVISFGGGV